MALSAQCRVYIAFDGSNPLTVSPTWTEVTSWVRSVSTNRGRASELDDFQAGTAQIELGNRDGRFSSYSGTYNVNIRIPVKIEAVASAVTYPVFRGVISDWDYTSRANDSVAVVNCVDMLGVLSTWTLPDTAHEAVVRPLGPSVWWRLDDPDTTAADYAPAHNALQYGTRERSDPLEVGGIGASRIATSATTAGDYLATGTMPQAFSSSDKCTIAAIVKTVLPEVGSTRVVRLSGSGDSLAIQVSNGVFIGNATQNTPSVNVQPGGSVAAEGVHHVALTRNGATVTVYVDGVSIGSSGAFGTGSHSYNFVEVAATTSSPATVDMTVDEVLAWDAVALSSTQVGQIAAAAFGWVQDSASARIERILDLLGMNASLIDLDDASSNVGVFQGGGDALSYLQSVARSDRGRLFVSKSGKVTFHSKAHDYGATASVLFDPRASQTGTHKYTGFGGSLNDRMLFNRVTTQGVDVEATAENTASQGTYSVRSLTWATQLPTVTTCFDQAATLVEKYESPSLRLKNWTVYPERFLNGSSSTRGYAELLGLELGDVVQVTDPATVSATLGLTSIAHQIDLPAGRWQITFAGVAPDVAQGFAWDVSEWDGTDEWTG